MSVPTFSIHPDVRSATLPPGELYGDPAWFAAIRAGVLGRAWHLLHEVCEADPDANAVPIDLDGQPLVWTRDGQGTERLLSNACTHRGALVVDAPCRARQLRCPYHGRRWTLDGGLAGAPGFEGAVDFPRPRDDLAAASLERQGPWRFGAVEPTVAFEDWLGPVFERIPWFDWAGLERDPAGDRDHSIEVNWALYVDNYLEGFHVSWVHPELASVLDPRDYRNELLPQGTVQIGLARNPADAFPLRAEGAEAGEAVAGYYFWLFPTTMVNVYPWGVSLNLVRPQGPMRTVVSYRRWVLPDGAPTGGAGGALDEVEREDQAVVARAQRGVRARLYPGGRYAPKHEVGLHHFHRLLAAALG